MGFEKTGCQMRNLVQERPMSAQLGSYHTRFGRARNRGLLSNHTINKRNGTQIDYIKVI